MADNKTLATFRLDAQLWEAFKAEVAKNGTNASAALTAYCRDYVSGASRQVSSSRIDKRIDETSPSIDIDSLDERIDRQIQDAVAAAQAELVSQTSHLLSEFQASIQQQQQQIGQQIEQLETTLMGEYNA
jgi:hypothetical protein